MNQKKNTDKDEDIQNKEDQDTSSLESENVQINENSILNEKEF